MEAYVMATLRTHSREEHLRAITSSQDTIVWSAGQGKKLQTLHSPVNFGGRFLRPSDKVACLFGFGTKATCVKMDEKSMTETPAFRTPTWATIQACMSIYDIENLEVPAVGGTIFTGSASFLPAPFLANAVIEADSDDCFELIRVLIGAAESYDIEHGEDEGFPTAEENIEHACLFLFGIGKGLIAESRFSIDPDDAEMKEYAARRHAECIQPPAGLELTPSNDPIVLSQLTESISRQNEHSQEANELRRTEISRQIDKESQKKNKFVKQHTSFKNMVLMASATDTDRAAEFPVRTCGEFFNAETAAHAGQELANNFDNIGMSDVEFGYGMVQALSCGSFLWTDSSNPRNF